MHVTLLTPLLPSVRSRFQGISLFRPSNARIESNVLGRLATAASGSVAWIASPSKINASYTLSVRLYPPCRFGWLRVKPLLI